MITRRTLLIGSSLTLTTVAASYLGYRSIRKPNAQKPLSTLSAIIDAIIPEDDSIGALSLNIDDQLQQQINNDVRLAGRFKRAEQGLEKLALSKHQTSFKDLPLHHREALTSALFTDETQQALRIDISIIKSNVCRLYYSHPDIQEEIGYLLPSSYPAYKNSHAL